ncbi:MAG: transporter [Rhodomicrobium sp.]
MKQTMTDIMTQITPFMTPLAYVGVAVLAIGILAWLLWLFSGWCTWLLRLTGRLLIFIGLVFLAIQAAAMFLQLPQDLDLGDLAMLGFKTRPFWVVGLIFFIPGFLLRIFGAFRPTH